MSGSSSESGRSSYEESAYSEEVIDQAVRDAGYDDFKACVAAMSTRGDTLTQIAEELGLNPQRFWAYYQVWCRENAEPLRLSEDDDD